MIIRLSAKLARKVGIALTDSCPLHDDPFADWSAHLFTAARVQYILVTNTATLYSVLIPGRSVSSGLDLVQRTNVAICEVLRDDGLDAAYQSLIASSADAGTFAKALNRSVTGSMNDLIQQAKFFLDTQNMSLRDAAHHLSDTPLSYLKYRTPRETLRVRCGYAA